MREYIDAYVTFLLTRQCTSIHTAAAYRRDAEQFVLYTMRRHKDRTSIDVRMRIIEFRDYLIRQGISSRSIARKLSSLRSFFNFLNEQVSLEAFKEYTAFSVGAPPRMVKQLPRACSQDDLISLFLAARKEKHNAMRAELICMLLYSAGLRVSELVAIRFNQIRLAEGTLTVLGKGGKTRTIPLADPVIALLRTYTQSSSSSTDRLFTLDRHGVWRLIKRLSRTAQLSREVSPHMLRHSFATDSLKTGWDLRSLQKFLGHEKISTTEIYIHLNTQFMTIEYRKKHPRGR